MVGDLVVAGRAAGEHEHGVVGALAGVDDHRVEAAAHRGLERAGERRPARWRRRWRAPRASWPSTARASPHPWPCRRWSARPHRPSPTACSVVLGTVSVVISASAAAAPPAASAVSCAPSLGTPDSIGAIGMGMPMSPVWHTSTSVVAQPTAWAVSSHIRSASARPCSPVAALALPELRIDRGGASVGEVPTTDLHRCGDREVAGEHAGGGDRRAVGGGDHRQVGCARLLDARGESARPEPGYRGDAHLFPLSVLRTGPLGPGLAPAAARSVAARLMA